MTAIKKAEGRWPTPTVQDGKNNAGPSQFYRNSAPLNVAALWPTPASRDFRAADGTLHGRGDANLNDMVALFPTCGCRNMASGAQLNPDWVEWLMGWPVGWTDLKCNAPRAYAIDADPATLAETDAAYVPRVTGRRDNRARRIMAIGNGQVPICAALAFADGLAALSGEAVT